MNPKLMIAAAIVITLGTVTVVSAQTSAESSVTNEVRAALTATTVALDARGNVALEGRLLTTMLNGAPDSPVTNVRMVIRNAAGAHYTYVTGWATFYASDGVRCGEGLFKLDALAPGEAAETDSPGLRVRCTPTTWRIFATNLLTRVRDAAETNEAQPQAGADISSTGDAISSAPANLIIAIDGEEHPIQLNNPLVVRMGNRSRRIVVRSAP